MPSANTPAAANSDVKDVAIPAPVRPAQQFRNYFLGRAREAATEDRGNEVIQQQMERIITAETDDDIWNADLGGVVQARDCVSDNGGMEVCIHTIEAALSTREDIDSRTGYYASMDAKCLGGPEDVLRKTGLAVGDDFVLQTGAELIITKVRAFEARDRLPINAVIVGIKTSGDNLVLKIRPLPVRPVPAQ